MKVWVRLKAEMEVEVTVTVTVTVKVEGATEVGHWRTILRYPMMVEV